MNDSRTTRWLTPRLVAVIGTALTLLLCAGGYFAAWRGYRKQFISDAALRATVVINALQNRLPERYGIQPLLEAALRSTDSLALDTTLADLSGASDRQLPYRVKVPGEISGQLPGMEDLLLFSLPTYTRDFIYAGRPWRISCAATHGYHADTVSLAFLLILPGGLLLTGLSASWLRQQLHSQKKVEILVNERTIELALTNGILSNEIDAHCRAMEALALSWNHMQTILDNLPMMAWLKDREGRFLLVNQQFAEAVGRPREEILRLTSFDVWPHHLAEYYHSVDEEIIATGRSKQIEEEIADVRGATWFEVFKAPITAADGTVVGTTGIAFNITGRKQKEELILAKKRELRTLNTDLEERIEEEITKNRAKDLVVMRQEKLASIGRLAAGVAHEINNPISFVSTNLLILTDYLRQMGAYLALQQELLAGSVAEEQRRDLATAAQRLEIPLILDDGPALLAESLDGVQRVARIVRDLKSFSRVDAPDYEPAELTACLESAFTIVANELKYLATVDKEYQELPPTFCHPSQLNQVFLNLLHTAGQAVTPPGRITLKSWFDESFVYASVEDNGHGIPEELRERIFEPFYTTRDVGKGTGLGLSIAHDIIAKHHGELLLESSIGVGTTFTVKLPRNAEIS